MTTSIQQLMAAERAKIRAALEARLVGAIKEPGHDTDLFCWCRKNVQRAEGTDTNLVMHGTVDEFIKAALDDVLGTGAAPEIAPAVFTIKPLEQMIIKPLEWMRPAGEEEPVLAVTPIGWYGILKGKSDEWAATTIGRVRDEVLAIGTKQDAISAAQSHYEKTMRMGLEEVQP